MTLFSIHCTTCRARIAVRNQSAIGQILACPKCGSMVQIVAPEGWTPGTRMPSDTPSPSAAMAMAPLATPQPSAERSMAWLPWALVSVAVLVVGALGWAMLSSGDDTSSTVVADVVSPTATEPAVPPAIIDSATPTEVEAPAVEPPAPDTTPPESATPTDPPPPPQPVAPPEPPAPPAPTIAELPATPVAPPTPQAVTPEPTPPLTPMPATDNVAAPPAIEVRPPDSVPAVDVAAQLAQPVDGLELNNIALVELIRFVSTATTVPISFDVESLRSAGRSPNDRVTYTSGPTTWNELLTAALATIGLKPDVEAGQVIVRSRSTAEPPAPALADDVAESLLAKQVSASFTQPTPLDTVLQRLESASGVTLIVHYAKLATVGRSGASPVELVVHDATLGDALSKLLPPLGLRYRAVDARTLEITTP